MSNNITESSINAALYPSNLQNQQDKYYARVVGSRTLSLDDIAQLSYERGGGNYKPDLIRFAVDQFFREVSRQIAAGNNVNTEWFKAQASVRGTFTGPHDTFDRERHSVNFNLEPGISMRQAADNADVVIRSNYKRRRQYIKSIYDHKSATTNTRLTPDKYITVHGCDIKIQGTADGNGLYFVNCQTSERITATDIPQNRPTMLLVQVPQLPDGQYYIEIITQYAHNKLRTTPTTITSTDKLTVAQ